MNRFVKNIADWSEVWALLIPLAALFVKKKQPPGNQTIIVYVWAALVLNACIDITWKFRTAFPVKFQSNNYMYNTLSIIRFCLFSTFFIQLRQPFLVRTKRLVQFFFLLFIIINFSFYQDFFDFRHLSSRLLSIEAALLLFYCLQYYLYKIEEDEDTERKHPDFWIVTGLGIYVTANFFIFLLYNELTVRLQNFAVSLWNIHNMIYIIFNVFLAKAFYESNG
ncbi:MAG: hypothetical protein ACXVJD_01790 [Mucilaginibacter sp.]